MCSGYQRKKYIQSSSGFCECEELTRFVTVNFLNSSNAYHLTMLLYDRHYSSSSSRRSSSSNSSSSRRCFNGTGKNMTTWKW
jgi:hypothetical protein